MRRVPLPMLAVLAALLVPAACGGGDATDGPAAPLAPEFPLRDVVAQALAALPAPEEPGELDADSAEELRGLCSLAGSDASMANVARDDVARISADVGAATVAQALVAIARDEENAERDRTAAIDLVPIDEPSGTDALAKLAGSATEGTTPWVRARAAWRLSTGGGDHATVALIAPLKYEKDHETVVWIAAALAHRANYAGIDGLIALAGMEESTARETARQELAAILAAVGLDSTATLWRAWREGDPDGVLPHPERSERYQREVWHWIGRLNEYQLRGVDDARFILERLDDVAAGIMGQALHEEDVYVRVHTAQSLERMGPRGVAACPELRAALGERELAPHAIIAMGSVGCDAAFDDILARLSESAPIEQRLAAARALGRLGDAGATPALRLLFDAEPAEIAQAACESVVLLDADATDAVERALGWIEDPRVEPASSERAVRAWLYEKGEDDTLARWDELATPADVAETREEARARRAERIELVRPLLRE